MGSRRRISLSWFGSALFLGVLAIGCHHDETTEETAPLTVPSAPAPVDHLAPGELVEGPQKIFGVAIPRELAIERQFVDVGYASGEPPQAAVASYFSTRVQGGKVTTGDRGAIFDAVHTAADPKRTLRIEVATANDGPYAGRGSHVTIRDITAVPQPDLPDEDARWKAAGLKPDGTLLDPEHQK